jgi:hypothetical protein
MCDVLFVSLLLRSTWPILYLGCARAFSSCQGAWLDYTQALRKVYAAPS